MTNAMTLNPMVSRNDTENFRDTIYTSMKNIRGDAYNMSVFLSGKLIYLYYINKGIMSFLWKGITTWASSVEKGAENFAGGIKDLAVNGAEFVPNLVGSAAVCI